MKSEQDIRDGLADVKGEIRESVKKLLELVDSHNYDDALARIAELQLYLASVIVVHEILKPQ